MNPMDENTIKQCNDCASKGLKYSQNNGRAQVMISEEYMKEARDGMSYMQQASALAEMMASGEFGEHVADEALEVSLIGEHALIPSFGTKPTLQMREAKPTVNPFSQVPYEIRNFTLAQTDAAEVLALQKEEANDGKDNGDDEAKKPPHPYPDLIGPDGEPFPDYVGPKPIPTSGGTATAKGEDGKSLPDRGEGAAIAKAKAEGKDVQDANPYGERRYPTPEKREAAEAKAPTLTECPETIYLRRSWSQDFFYYMDCAEKDTDIEWNEDKQFSEKLLTKEQKQTLAKAREEASAACDKAIEDAGGNFAIFEKMAEDLIGVGIQDKYEINEFWENIAAPASRIKCTAPCKRKRVEPVWWTTNYEVVSKDIVKQSFHVVKDVDFGGTYVVVECKIRAKIKAKFDCIFKVTCEE